MFYNYIQNFLNSDNDIIIIKGEYVDYSKKSGSILGTISKSFPDVEKEIVILCPSSLEVAYERMKNTEWFKADYETNKKRFPKKWLDFANKYMKRSLYEFEETGYKVIEIDTLDGYSISSKEMPKNM